MKRLLLLFLLLLPGFLSAQTDTLLVTNQAETMEEYQEEIQPTLTWKDRREPLLAGFLSYMMPGLGQVYNKQYEKAFGIMAVVASSMVMGERYARMGNDEAGAAVFCIGIGGSWLFSFIDAMSSASKINKSILLGHNTSMSLKPELQYQRTPYLPGIFKSEPLLGLKFSLSL